ncbi:unnamed protein product [Mytilus edulis]|uniref:Uncharacterized protein n=1 Tax=Mytilus edulis TaxID=6550 RepID=A0A8S3Q3R4_MYTED|nr:unnamed protein product [Mytilus edulis]
MKLVDKVVLFVFGAVLVAYIVYVYDKNTKLGSQQSLRVPLLKDKLIWKPQDVVLKRAPQDAVLKRAVDALKVQHPIKPNITKALVLKNPAPQSFLSDKILQDGLKVSFIRNKLQVNIVEENEKALVYWLSMAKYKMIKMTGNTLILFSNQLDMSVPPYFQHFPFHRVPQNDKEMLYVLQSGGTFLMKAILTGIIKRIIWIRPSWIKKPSSAAYSKQLLGIGMIKTKTRISYCTCQLNKCIIQGSNKATTQCHLKMNVLVENLKETAYQKKSMEKNWLPQADILLHIDSTYFGYISPSAMLSKMIPDGKVLEKIDNLSKKLFCPKSIPDEIYIDRLMLKAIEYSLIEKECAKNNTKKIKTGPFAKCVGVKKANFKMDEEIYKFLKRKLVDTDIPYLCSKYTHFVDFLIKEMSTSLTQRRIPQLGILKLTGFCLSTTVKAPGQFGLCKGSKAFGQTTKFMPSHRPTMKEIKAKIDLLRPFLKRLPVKSVKTITFCRNVRHGYAPRLFLPLIETSLLKSFNISFPRFTLNYDRHILGHKQGWFYRTYLKDTL